MNILTVSHIALWVVQLVTIALLVGLTRQVGILHLRVPPRGPGSIDEGPPIGTPLEMRNLISLKGNDVPLFVQGSFSLIFLSSRTCSLCGEVLSRLPHLLKAESELRVVVAVEDRAEGKGDSLLYLAEHGIADGVKMSDIVELDVPTRPFSAILDGSGVLRASGVVNNLEQVEDLLALAIHRFREESELSVEASRELPLVESSLDGP